MFAILLFFYYARLVLTVHWDTWKEKKHVWYSPVINCILPILPWSKRKISFSFQLLGGGAYSQETNLSGLTIRRWTLEYETYPKNPCSIFKCIWGLHFLIIIRRMENKLNLLCVKFLDYKWKRKYCLAREGSQSTFLIHVVTIKYTHYIYNIYIYMDYSIYTCIYDVYILIGL